MTFVRSHWKTVLGLALLTLLASNVVRYVTSPSADRVRADDVHRAERVVEGSDDRDPLPPGDWVGGNGVVEPRDRETKLAPSVPGRIAVVSVREGQRVEVGAVLLELEHDAEQAALAAAEADLRAAQADLARVSRGNRTEDVESAEADAAASRARADTSADRLARLESVVSAGGVSTEELERARRTAQSEEEQARSLEARLRAVRGGSRTEEVSAARARAAAAAARRDQARVEVERRIVRSPIAATVLQLKYRVGEFVQPGQGDPLVVLGDLTELRVRMDLDERDVGKIHVGGTALVRAIAFPGRDFAGRIVEIAQRMGRKNVRSDDPTELNDTKILEVVMVVDQPGELVVGQRVMAFARRQSR